MPRSNTRRKPPAEPLAYNLKAERLRAAWKQTKVSRKISQKELASVTDVTDSTISQLLKGRMEMNPEWQLRFARYLRIPVVQIWPDFEYADLCTVDLPPDVVAFARKWMNLPETVRDKLEDLIDATSDHR